MAFNPKEEEKNDANVLLREKNRRVLYPNSHATMGFARACNSIGPVSDQTYRNYRSMVSRRTCRHNLAAVRGCGNKTDRSTDNCEK